MNHEQGMRTPPDYLASGLDIVFVGINPGLQSARVGHYFATPTNRFWTALNRSGLLTEPLDAGTDDQVLRQGIGFTDVVKRPSNSASKLPYTVPSVQLNPGRHPASAKAWSVPP